MTKAMLSMKNGCYKLSWRERIGFSAGDLAQNLIYQTVSIWLLFFYTDVYGLKPHSPCSAFGTASAVRSFMRTSLMWE